MQYILLDIQKKLKISSVVIVFFLKYTIATVSIINLITKLLNLTVHAQNDQKIL